MLKFIQRLNRLIDTMLDLDSLTPVPGRIRPVPIKVIFDNLRYYTVLAFMALGFKLLRTEGTSFATASATILGLFILALLILVAMQTALILLVTAFTAISALIPPRTAVAIRRKLRSDDKKLKVAALLLTLPIVAIALVIATTLSSALMRSGAI